MTTQENQWLGTKEACQHLGVTVRTLYKLIDEGELRAYRPGRVIRLRRRDLDAFLERVQLKPGQLGHLYGRRDDAEGGQG